MSDIEIRIEALRLAAASGANSAEVVRVASEIEDYVLGGGMTAAGRKILAGLEEALKHAARS